MKKKILIISAQYFSLFASIYFYSWYCENYGACHVYENELPGILIFVFLPLMPIFILSLLTYRMRDRVFLAWWSFAKWWAPLIMISTLFMNTIGTGSGNSLGSGMVEGFVYFILYGVLITVSLVRIVRARR